ncbi:ComEC/Rec2 family competence protein [Thermaerobacter subterraneus]|uniref:ComEC/Rec2-related protein n=1 Tax=Thermaerobacter subterraneus DSM 13965 TaxID=867903 RepID=K6PPU2_9FIRM|nr:ComEC/Rec2 family competence protein [Thermaerobacter subterraneus]EKP94947.1 ComEC/Rec2-related protein [Thermaerobacter subterraneus DSM 13965]
MVYRTGWMLAYAATVGLWALLRWPGYQAGPPPPGAPAAEAALLGLGAALVTMPWNGVAGDGRGGRRPWWVPERMAGSLLVALAAGSAWLAADSWIRDAWGPAPWEGVRPVVVTGRLEGAERLAVTAIGDTPVRTRLRVRWPRTMGAGPGQGIPPGAVVQVTGTLRRLRPATNPGGYDDRAAGLRQGYAYELRADGPPRVQVAPGPFSWAGRGLARLRHALEAGLVLALPPGPRGVAAALLLDQRQGLSVTARNALAETGLIHALAVSGQHVAMAAALATWTAGRARWLPRRRRAGAMAVVVLYAGLTGGPPSVLRATATFLLAELARALARPVSPLTILVWSGFLQAAWRPLVLLDPGFQLSFAATAGLILLGSPLQRAWRRWWNRCRALVAPVGPRRPGGERAAPAGLAATRLEHAFPEPPLGFLAPLLANPREPVVEKRHRPGAGPAPPQAAPGQPQGALVPSGGSRAAPAAAGMPAVFADASGRAAPLGLPWREGTAGRVRGAFWHVAGWAGDALAVTLAAQLAVLPVQVALFGRAPLLALVANLAVVPVSAVALVAAAAAAALGATLHALPLPSGWQEPAALLARLAGWPAAASLALMVKTAMVAGRVPGAAGGLAPAAAGCLALATTWILWCLGDGRPAYARRRRPRPLPPLQQLAPAATGLVAAVALSAWLLRPPAPGTWVAWFLDVGQGDAILVQFPGGRSALVDAGGKALQAEPGRYWPGPPPVVADAVGEQVTVPVVRRLLGRGPDLLVVTHGDRDHAGGAGAVIEQLGAQMVWLGGIPGVPLDEALQAAAARRGVPLVRPAAGWRWQPAPGCRVDVLHPQEPGGAAGTGAAAADGARGSGRGGGPAGSENDRSLVLRLDCGGPRLLLTGDLERAGEEELLRRGVDLRAEVLKVSHHGSRGATTAAFLAAVRPRLAVVSAGPNPYGLPHVETLARLQRAGIPVLRTDRLGAVSVRAGPGQRLEVRVMLPGGGNSEASRAFRGS